MQRERGNMDTLAGGMGRGQGARAAHQKAHARGAHFARLPRGARRCSPFLLPVFVSMFGIFHPAALRGIRPGDTREQVVEALGEPDASYAGGLEYGGVHFWRVPATGSYIDLYGRSLELADLVDFIARRWYVPHIAVELDSFDRVVSVTLDADRPKAGVQKHKRLTSVFPPADGSAALCRNGSVVRRRVCGRQLLYGPRRGGLPLRRVRLDADGRLGRPLRQRLHRAGESRHKRSGNYAEGEDWYITPEFELHILSDAGAQAFLHSGFDRSVIESAVFDYAAETVPESLLNGCYSLREVSLPNGLRTIESSAFADCMSLESIRLPASLESISDWAFSRCSALQAVELPASLREIGPGAFEGCDRLEEIVIPDSVQTIGYSAFSYCTSLRSVRLPAGLRGIDAFLFEACSSLEQIELPASVTSVGDYAFSATSLREITIPQGVTSIGELAFANTPAHRGRTPPRPSRRWEQGLPVLQPAAADPSAAGAAHRRRQCPLRAVSPSRRSNSPNP